MSGLLLTEGAERGHGSSLGPAVVVSAKGEGRGAAGPEQGGRDAEGRIAGEGLGPTPQGFGAPACVDVDSPGPASRPVFPSSLLASAARQEVFRSRREARGRLREADV